MSDIESGPEECSKEFSLLGGDLDDNFYSLDGYPVNLHDDRWVLSKDISFRVGALCDIFPGDSDHLRNVLASYAMVNSPSYARFIFAGFLHYVRRLGEEALFSVESILSYRSRLGRGGDSNTSSVRIIMRQWDRLGYPGVSTDALFLLDKLVLKGNVKGRAVESMCPDEGPLTDIEVQGLVDASMYAFARGDLCLENMCLVMVLVMTGRRPAQISALKIKDLICEAPGKYWINFPQAKQKGKPWRSSFKKFAIVEDLWQLLQLQAEQVRCEFAEGLALAGVSANIEGRLPLFPKMQSADLNVNVQELLESDRLHIPSHKIYYKLKDTAKLLGVRSERTGISMHLNPKRFRYTLGTNLAREGQGVYVIAEALDHSNTQNAGVYVKNIPDIVKRIDKAVALQLAPIAQAFQGVLISTEREALRGNDPSSRISNGRANVGNCGSYGFCGALAPIACYTCAHFQPWIDGAHEEVLDRLIEERDRVAEQTGDLKIASANDRLILAVGDVIRRCKVQKEGMANG